MECWILDLIRSYSQVLEENGATDNGGKPNVKGFIRWIVVELLRWRNVEVEWGPVGTASSSPFGAKFEQQIQRKLSLIRAIGRRVSGARRPVVWPF